MDFWRTLEEFGIFGEVQRSLKIEGFLENFRRKSLKQKRASEELEAEVSYRTPEKFKARRTLENFARSYISKDLGELQKNLDTEEASTYQTGGRRRGCEASCRRKGHEATFVRMKATGSGHWRLLALIVAILSMHAKAEKQKRQIFREQVLPALGGKIPEEAFRTDRLALNRLNKEGISVPDGVVLDARRVQKHPYPDQTMPDLIKVYLTPDGRYVPPEGRFHYNHPKAVDTTYLIRKPFSRNPSSKPANQFAANKHRGLIKPQSYSNVRQFRPWIPPAKPGVYKPIVAPLVIPAGSDLLEESYLPTWNLGYEWETIYEPLDDYYVDNIALFNSHQIITDYQGFLNEFHERSSRHVGSKPFERNQRYPQKNSHQSARTNSGKAFQGPGYTNLTKIPETGFSCRGRKGLFADVETKCQVFHNCSGWSKTSSLCPSGTAFSESKKRCEWWNTVQCRD
ncbi:hypothetical protein KM043_003483 [Ampulex compressa]|nr:hypothetical protein KM043_003483 [Ampulex compressa]